MNVKGIKRARDLHFKVPPQLAEDIDRLVDAMARDDSMLDCHLAQLEGSARMVQDEYDRWIYAYYLRGGWREDVVQE